MRKGVIITVIVAIALIVGGTFAVKNRTIHYMEGVVQEKAFDAGQTSSVTTINPSNGQLQVGTSSTSDEYIIFVNDEGFSVDRRTWLHVEKGDHVGIHYSWLGAEELTILEGN